MQINSIWQIKFGNTHNAVYNSKAFASFHPQTINTDSFEISNNSINQALKNIEELKFSKKNIKKVQKYGAKLAFNSGKEAIEYAKSNNISIVFGKVDQPDVHAQWVNDKRTIIINDRYKNSQNPAEIYAISAAILHELAHSKDNDGISSIQEEIDCLALNALAYDFYDKKYPELFKNSSAPIIQDGVALYAKLFLEKFPQELKERIKLKYGNLPTESPFHPADKFALKVSEEK